AELVTIPFKWYPGTRVLDQAFLWRLVDLTESDGRPIDRLIATKFPAYAVRHPEKVAWVLHQFRQAYDYDRTELGQFSEAPADRAAIRARERLQRALAAAVPAPRGDRARLARRASEVVGDVAHRRRPARAIGRSRSAGAPAPAPAA